MILVHQMAKVASRSWVEAAKPASTTEGSVPIHCHYVLPFNRERMGAVFNLQGARQTIAHMYLPRYLIRASVWGHIEAARQRQEKIRVVSGVRDPLERSISLIVYLSDFVGHVSRPLNRHADVSPDYVMGALQENWRLVLERKQPDQTFEWLLWYLTDGFRTWFASELGAVFGVDVLKGSFEREGAMQRMNTSAADIFTYRVEDMLPQASGHARLLAEASSFLGTTLKQFPHFNTNATRRSRALSEEVRRHFWLPDEMLDAIYSEPVVQHFYSREEIIAFKERWSRSRFRDAQKDLSNKP